MEFSPRSDSYLLFAAREEPKRRVSRRGEGEITAKIVIPVKTLLEISIKKLPSNSTSLNSISMLSLSRASALSVINGRSMDKVCHSG